MFSRKLRALGYDGRMPINLEDPQEYRELVLWIETTKLPWPGMDIRRHQEFSTCPAATWPTYLKEYITSLSCPWDGIQQRAMVVDWLLRRAVMLEHKGLDYTFKISGDFNRVMVLKGDSTKGAVVENAEDRADALKNLDADTPEFIAGVNSLAKSLNICPYENPRVTLEAIVMVVENHVAYSEPENPKGKEAKYIFPLDEMSVGMDVKDAVLKKAVKIVRLLHMAQLRDLQTRFDEALVALQQVTADPKTDQSLGKVGSG